MLEIKRMIAMAAAALAVLSLVFFISSVQDKNSVPDDFMDVEIGKEIDASSEVLDVTRIPWTEESIDGSTFEEGKVFRYAISSLAGTFDPAFTNTEAEDTIVYHIYEGLYRTVDGELVPAGATSVDISEDGLTYTFHLNEKARWSDGRKVTAKDYAYGIRRHMNPVLASPTAYLGDVVKNGAAVRKGNLALSELGVRAEGDYTLVITLEHPAEYFLYMLQTGAFCPVRSDYVEIYGESYCSSSGHQVYNGPFSIRSIAEKMIVLERNPNYWDASNVKLDRVVIHTAIDGDAATRLYHEGKLDYADLPYSSANTDNNAIFYMDGAVDYVVPNFDNRFLANKNLRMAISYAIDRNSLSGISGNEAFLRFVPSYVLGVDGGTYGRLFPYDAVPASGDEEIAKNYLQAALSELGCRAKDISLRAVTVDNGLCQAEALMFIEQVTRVLGININLITAPYSVRNAIMIPHSEEFDLLFTGWMPDYPDALSFLEPFVSDGSMNFSNYSSYEYDNWIAKSGLLFGEERQAALFEAEKTLLDDGAVFAFKVRSGQYLLGPEFTHLSSYWVGHSLEYIFADKEE